MTEKPVINIDDVPLADRGNGKSFAVKWGRVGPALGLNALGCAVHVVPPGKKAFPFHRHHVMDELFFILSGEGQYRWGDETLPIKTGDLVRHLPAPRRTSSSIPAMASCAISAFPARRRPRSSIIRIPAKSA